MRVLPVVSTTAWSGAPMHHVNLSDSGQTGAANRWDGVPASPGPSDLRAEWRRRVDAAAAAAFPPAGQLGHGCTAVLRRQPARLVDGRVEGGYTGVFEIVCCDCGDNPFLDYSHVSARLQKVRGPFAIAEGIAAYEAHLGIEQVSQCDCVKGS
jgi:hypothetical protein